MVRAPQTHSTRPRYTQYRPPFRPRLHFQTNPSWNAISTMDGHSSQPLTRDNLNNHNGGRAAQTYRVSCVRADVARQQLYQLLWTLGRIGPRGQHILKGLDVYIAAPQNVRCRESSLEEPDPNDVQYWEDKLQSYRDRYTPVIQLEEAKGRVYSEMMVLHQFGRDGARALAQDELYIAGPYDVRRAADRHSDAPLEDVCYWDEKWQHFHNVVETLKSACPRVASPAALTINGSPAVSYASDDEATSPGRQNKVEAWVHTLQNNANAPSQASTPNIDCDTHTDRRREEARKPNGECLQEVDEGAVFVRQYATDQRSDRMHRSPLLPATSKHNLEDYLELL